MKLVTSGKQQHIQQRSCWVLSCKEGEEDVWKMTNMMFEEWLWMMAKEEGGVRVFVGSQKPLEPCPMGPAYATMKRHSLIGL